MFFNKLKKCSHCPHKIASNRTAMMDAFPSDDLPIQDLHLSKNALPLQHSLGICLNLVSNMFTFRVQDDDKPFDKRSCRSPDVTPLSPPPAPSLKNSVFADASVMAISAVAYLKITHQNNQHDVGFVFGKSKLAPVRERTIPRLCPCCGNCRVYSQ